LSDQIFVNFESCSARIEEYLVHFDEQKSSVLFTFNYRRYAKIEMSGRLHSYSDQLCKLRQNLLFQQSVVF